MASIRRLSTGLQSCLLIVLLFGVFFHEGKADDVKRGAPLTFKGKSPKRTTSAGGANNVGGGGANGAKCAALYGPHCSTCSPGFKGCTFCESGFKLVNGKCEAFCQSGFKLVDGICTRYCESGFKLVDGNCYADCGFGLVGNDVCYDELDCSCGLEGPFRLNRFCGLNVDGISSYCVNDNYCPNLATCTTDADCASQPGYVCQASCCGLEDPAGVGRCFQVAPECI